MSKTQPTKPSKSIKQEAETLERKFGELAATYAENRSEAAQLRGAGEAAEHWSEVKDEVADFNQDKEAG